MKRNIAFFKYAFLIAALFMAEKQTELSYFMIQQNCGSMLLLDVKIIFSLTITRVKLLIPKTTQNRRL